MVATENPNIETPGQAEMRVDLINMRDPDITQAVLLNGGTSAAATTTRDGAQATQPAHRGWMPSPPQHGR